MVLQSLSALKNLIEVDQKIDDYNVENQINAIETNNSEETEDQTNENAKVDNPLKIRSELLDSLKKNDIIKDEMDEEVVSESQSKRDKHFSINDTEMEEL